MKNKPTDLERIQHMIDAINKIFRYTDGLDYEKFHAEEMVQDAVIKNFEIIGEAAYNLSNELKNRYTGIEWKKIEGLRHILVHDYYKINPEILWNTKEKDLAVLKIDIQGLLDSERE